MAQLVARPNRLVLGVRPVFGEFLRNAASAVVVCVWNEILELVMAKQYRTATPEERKRDGEKALAEQRARDEAVNKNMARLRALRLERGATGGRAPDQEKAEKKPPAKLARYLKHQKNIGRS
jgi:hypothetical protein